MSEIGGGAGGALKGGIVGALGGWGVVTALGMAAGLGVGILILNPAIAVAAAGLLTQGIAALGGAIGTGLTAIGGAGGAWGVAVGLGKLLLLGTTTLIGGMVAANTLGLGAAGAGGLFGGVVGGIRGQNRARTEVAQQHSNAQLLDAQIAAYQAQAAAAASADHVPAAAGNKYGFPSAGTAMNEAAPTITSQDGARAESRGRLGDAQQLTVA